jgi:clan AA aspartic protease (TIGR02281 family)
MKYSLTRFNLKEIESMGSANRLFIAFTLSTIGLVVGGQAILSRMPFDPSFLTAHFSTPISGKVTVGSEDSVIPLEHLGGVWVARVELNDFHEARLIVDTGATFTTISEDLAFDAGIQSESPNSRINLVTAGGRVQAELGVARRIRVGNTGRDDVRVVIHTIPNLPDGIDGLLGLSFFDRFLVRLDHSNQQLHLSPRT